jgi:ferritin-like metal-binding protein YciE
MKTLENLFLEELADIYDAENRLTRALPKVARAATHHELKQAFQTHLSETEQQVKRLQRVFKAFDKPPRGKKCKAMVGLLKEADEIASENKGSPTINAALISAAQKVEHYEIASYGCLREWAEQLGNQTAADILQEILEEEKTADRTLTEQARARCNESAVAGEDQPPAPRFGRAPGSRGLRPIRARVVPIS